MKKKKIIYQLIAFYNFNELWLLKMLAQMNAGIFKRQFHFKSKQSLHCAEKVIQKYEKVTKQKKKKCAELTLAVKIGVNIYLFAKVNQKKKQFLFYKQNK